MLFRESYIYINKWVLLQYLHIYGGKKKNLDRMLWIYGFWLPPFLLAASAAKQADHLAFVDWDYLDEYTELLFQPRAPSFNQHLSSIIAAL